MEEKRSPGQPSLMDPGCETQVSGAQPELTDVGGYVVARIKTTNHTFGQGTSRWCPHGSIAVQSIHLCTYEYHNYVSENGVPALLMIRLVKLM
jgi:peroxiredoxin